MHVVDTFISLSAYTFIKMYFYTSKKNTHTQIIIKNITENMVENVPKIGASSLI